MPTARVTFPFLTAGLAGAAFVGAGALTAPSGGSAPEVMLTTVECQIGDALCQGNDGLIGQSGNADAGLAFATASGDPLGFLFGNGTPDHPDAGLLIGDGYDFTENDVDVTPYCVAGSPCNGGNAGLLFGNGGNGYDGGSGGSAYLYGLGGNGGNAVDFGLLGETNNGGNGGQGGIFGGTDSGGNLFKGGGGNGGNGIHGGNGGDGGDSGWGFDLFPALIDRVFGLSIPIFGNDRLGLGLFSLSGPGGKGGNGGDGFVGLVNGNQVSAPDGGAGGNGGDAAFLPTFDPGTSVHTGGNGGSGGRGGGSLLISGYGGDGGSGGSGNAGANPGKLGRNGVSGGVGPSLTGGTGGGGGAGGAAG